MSTKTTRIVHTAPETMFWPTGTGVSIHRGRYSPTRFGEYRIVGLVAYEWDETPRIHKMWKAIVSEVKDRGLDFDDLIVRVTGSVVEVDGGITYLNRVKLEIAN